MNNGKHNETQLQNHFGLIISATDRACVVSAFIIIIVSVFGITKLEVENSFINYFDKKTEIYKGMKLIDDKLGGTTPLDVIVKFPSKEAVEKSEDDFDSWDDEEKDESK